MNWSKFLPNFELMKSPFNWFVVAFSVALLILLIHFAVKATSQDKD